MKTTNKMFTFLLVFVFVFVTLLACNKETETTAIIKQELAQVSVDTIHYDGETLSWSLVNNADSYEIKYDDKTTNVTTNKYPVIIEKDVTFSIRALASTTNKYYFSATKKTEKSFTYKGKITPVLNKETKSYSWEAIDGAIGYEIKENGTLYQGYQQDLTYKIVSKYDETEDAYLETFTVRANFDTENSFAVWSDLKTIKTLKDVENITYNGRVAEWEEIKGASKYQVKVYDVDSLGKETVKAEDTVSSPSYVYNSFGDADSTNKGESTVVSGTYSISVIAISSDENTISSDDKRFSFTYVDPIVEIAMTEGVISWESVVNADYYILEVNGVTLEEKIRTNRYTGFMSNELESYQVRVTPRKDDGTLYSGWSAKFTFVSVDAPYLNWVGDAQGYSLDWSKKKDNSTYNFDNTTFEVIIKEYKSGNIVKSITTTTPSYSGEELLDAIGTTKGVIRTVQVKAIKSGAGLSTTSESFLSSPIYFYNLNDPSAYTITTKEVYTNDLTTTLYINDIQIADDFNDYNLEVLYRAGVKTAFGKYNTDEAVDSTTIREITIPKDSMLNGTKVSIAYKAESKDNKKLLINSDNEKCVFIFSDTVTEIECERLSSPNVSLSGTVLKWSAISMSSSYQILCKDLEGNQVGDIQFSVGPSFNIQDLGLEAGKYDFYVSALGNGNIIFSSLYSNPIRINQLSTPTELKITGTGDDRQITWKEVEDCSSYQVTIGTHIYTVNDSKQLKIEQNALTISGVNVYVQAMGNNENNTLTSLTSEVITLYKLKTPTNVQVDDNGVSWNSVDAYGDQLVGYEIYIESEKISGDTPLTETFFDYNTYAGIRSRYDEMNLNFEVRAVLINENTRYFSSEKSAITNITRLASPTNVKLNQYTGKITWESGDLNLSTISGYEVKIAYSNHQELTETYITSLCSLSPKFNETCVGDTVTITVRTLGNGVDNVSSNPNNAITGENKIGCTAILEKLETLNLTNNPIEYSVDDFNHIKVIIDETKLDTTNAYAYGIKIDGVLNVVPRYNSNLYTKEDETNTYRYDLNKGSYALYDTATNTYTFISRHSDEGSYDIDIKYVGGNYSKDTTNVASDIKCFVDSDYTGVIKTIIILGDFSESDVSYKVQSSGAKYIELKNKNNAISYEYEIEYLSMGKGIEGIEKISSIISKSDGDITDIVLDNIPDITTAIRITLRVKGDSENYIFDSVNKTTFVLIIPNVNLTK